MLDFSDDALYYIAKKSKENGTGARGLKSIIEKTMLDVMFEIPDCDNIKKVTVCVKKGELSYTYTKKQKKAS